MGNCEQVSRARLDKLANLYMDELHDRCGYTPMSLDEFLVQYDLAGHDLAMGQAILSLYPEYGGENDPQ